VTATDLNGDGRTDLAVLSRDGHNVNVMLNAGASVAGPVYTIVATNPGATDVTFGTFGRVITPFIGSSATDLGMATAVQQTYGYLVAGRSSNTFGVARYHFGGSLDTSFGQNGVGYFAIGQFGLANAMAVQTDGKIVLAGYAQISGQNKMVVLRVNVNGSLDTTFNGTGWIAPDVSGGPTRRRWELRFNRMGRSWCAGMRTRRGEQHLPCDPGPAQHGRHARRDFWRDGNCDDQCGGDE